MSGDNLRFNSHHIFMLSRWKTPGIFLSVVLLALGWAFYTQHAWEDYYITYRASKNLATGHGLTFTVGERVHSFTSPLGVLLPALASLLTGNTSDAAALWIFRLMGAAALAGVVLILRQTLRRLALGGIVIGLMAAAVLSDAKILDFTINGMETPFLLLLLAWVLWALFTQPQRQWLHLGLAWAGLQWVRPDAFVYIGALAVGVLLFRPTVSSWRERFCWLREFTRAGFLAFAGYAPWLIWAWTYYGTPVPHTIIAKGMFAPKASLGVLFAALKNFPAKIIADHSILAGTFMPAYSVGTGWPAVADQASCGLALVAISLWFLPRVRWEARVASLAASVGQFYLHTFVSFPVPWYLPAVTLLALVALVLVWGQLWQSPKPKANASAGFQFRRALLAGGAGLLLICMTSISVGAAYQLRWQQKLIEEGQRRVMGEWLRASASSSRDTVFLEPLGYIGFYSGLKMYDYPGLCSPEVVAARRRATSPSYPYCWSELIMDLQPDWLVLRRHEAETIQARDPEVLQRFYEMARVFDVRPEVEAIRHLPGRGYLLNDAYFEIYHRRAGVPAGVGLQRIRADMLIRNECWGQPAYDTGMHLQSHAPAHLECIKPAGARWLTGGLGFLETAYAHPPDSTDGAIFTVSFLAENGTRRMLLERSLRPSVEASDRGTQNFRIELPAGESGKIELTISPGPQGNNAYDWTYWSDLTLQTPH